MTGTQKFSVNPLVPKAVFLTKGVGIHSERLNSFEEALREARISAFNLVTVSSIVPPNCQLLDIEEGLGLLSPGQLTFSVMSRCDSNEEGRLMAAAVAILLPKTPLITVTSVSFTLTAWNRKRWRIGSVIRRPNSMLQPRA